MDKDFSDMINKFLGSTGKAESGSASGFGDIPPYNVQSKNEQNNFPNFDVSTFLKLKSVMDKMNNYDDPRSNLLKSLKPYLRNDRKTKVDQYISLFNMAKIMEAFRENGGDSKW